MTRLRAAAGLVGWLAILAVGIWLLGRAGSGDLAAPPLTHGGRALQLWVGQRDAATIVIALVRVAALALGWYALGSSVLAIAVRATRQAALITVADAVTIPAIRRVVASAAGVLLVASPAAIAAPAFAGAPSPPVIRPIAPDDAPVLHSLPDVPSAATPPPPALPLGPAPAAGGRPAPTPAPTPTPRTWTVQPGESFWSIATHTLDQSLGRPPTDAEIDPYWRSLIARNRARLADPANPDLLYPAQRLELP